MATASDVVLNEIPLPIFKGTYIPTQQSYAEYVPVPYNGIRL